MSTGRWRRRESGACRHGEARLHFVSPVKMFRIQGWEAIEF